MVDWLRELPRQVGLEHREEESERSSDETSKRAFDSMLARHHLLSTVWPRRLLEPLGGQHAHACTTVELKLSIRGDLQLLWPPRNQLELSTRREHSRIPGRTSHSGHPVGLSRGSARSGQAGRDGQESDPSATVSSVAVCRHDFRRRTCYRTPEPAARETAPPSIRSESISRGTSRTVAALVRPRTCPSLSCRIRQPYCQNPWIADGRDLCTVDQQGNVVSRDARQMAYIPAASGCIMPEQTTFVATRGSRGEWPPKPIRALRQFLPSRNHTFTGNRKNAPDNSC